VNHLHSSSYGCSHHLILIKLLNRVVTGDDQMIIVKRQRTSLNLTTACISVRPDLEIMSKAVCVHVVYDDGLLTGITIPPFVLSF